MPSETQSDDAVHSVKSRHSVLPRGSLEAAFMSWSWPCDFMSRSWIRDLGVLSWTRVMPAWLDYGIYIRGIPDPTRTRGYGSGRVDVSRVGSGTGMTSTATGIPGFTRKEHDFARLWSENLFISACFLNYL